MGRNSCPEEHYHARCQQRSGVPRKKALLAAFRTHLASVFTAVSPSLDRS